MALLPALLPRLLSFDAEVDYQAAFEAPGIRALQQATQLTSLTLSQSFGELGTAVANELAAALSQLLGLAALSLTLPAVTQAVVGSLTLLTGLTQLSLHLRSASLPAPIAQLTRLSRLQHLTVWEGSVGQQQQQQQQPMQEWPAPRAFHSLQSFSFRASDFFAVSCVC